MKRILILGIDTFAAKNLAQIEMLSRKGYAFTIATTDRRADSQHYFKMLGTHAHTLHVLPAHPLKRLAAVIRLLKQGPYSHIELYAAGRCTLLYLPVLKYFKCRWIVVERGDIGSMDEYSFTTRLAIQAAYRHADAVWYKEPYMHPLLDAKGARKLYFVPNAAQIPDASRGNARRDIDFLWVNRLVHVRYPDWIVRSASDPELASRTLAMLGFQDAERCEPETLKRQIYAQKNRPPGLSLHGFTDPFSWYPRARFFVLPARFVFGNNALLEAMAHGVVPIVTQSPGVDMLIQDGVNGLVADQNETSFRSAMRRAARMEKQAWESMSQAALHTIAQKFNLDTWTNSMARMYEELAC